MYADIVILACLQRQPLHGYEIKKQVERALAGAVPLNNKVLYPALKRFEEMGAVRREVERQEGKPDRHVYFLNERGMEILQALLREFSPALLANHAEFLVRVAFFDLLEPDVRLEILRIREAIVQEMMLRYGDLKQLSGSAMSHAVRVLRLQEQQKQLELDWLRVFIQEQEMEATR